MLFGPGKAGSGSEFAYCLAMMRGIFLAITLSFNWVYANQVCGSPRLTQALQYLEWHQNNIYYNQQVRVLALEESMNVLSSTHALALASSLTFLICVSFLAAAITYRVLAHRNLAVLLGVVYFIFFGMVLKSSNEAITSVTSEFRTEANTLQAQNWPAEVSGPESLRNFIRLIDLEQSRVPEVYNELSSYLPEEGRWWTIGWDDVGLIGFQNEAYRAFIRKSSFGLRAISNLRQDLERKCRDSGLQI